MLEELAGRVREMQVSEKILTRIVNALDAEQLIAHDPIGGYSPRNTVAHLAGATRSMTIMAKKWVKGESTALRPDFDLNLFNRRLQEKRADMSLQELLNELREANHEIAEFMETLTLEDLDKRGDHPAQTFMTVRELMRVVAYHEAMHTVLVLNATTP